MVRYQGSARLFVLVLKFKTWPVKIRYWTWSWQNFPIKTSLGLGLNYIDSIAELRCSARLLVFVSKFKIRYWSWSWQNFQIKTGSWSLSQKNNWSCWTHLDTNNTAQLTTDVINMKTVERQQNLNYVCLIWKLAWKLVLVMLIKIKLLLLEAVQIRKITRRTTGARGYKFELFQGIF